jgi:two-component system, sensor histidine kinase and response regulator
MKRVLILILVLAAIGPLHGQILSQLKKHSLGTVQRAQVQRAIHDTVRVDSLRRLASQYIYQKKVDSAYRILKQGLHLANRLHDPRYLGMMYYELAEYFFSRKQSKKYIISLQKAIYFFQKADQVDAASRAMAELAREYAVNFEQAKSIEQCYQNLAYAQRTNFYAYASPTYALLYTIHMNFGHKKKAFADLMELKKMAERFPTPENKYLAFSNLAEWHEGRQNYSGALLYWKQILAFDIRSGDSLAIVESYHCIAANLLKLNEPEKAEIYLNKGLRVISRYQPVSANFYLTLAQLRELQNRLPDARKSALTALENARKTYQPFLIQFSMEVLARIQEKQGNFRGALQTTHQLKALSDSINEMSHLRAINDIESQYALEKKEKNIKVLKQEKLIQQQRAERVQQQKMLYISLATGLGMLLILMGWVVRKDRGRLYELNAQKAKLTLQTKRLEELNEVKNKLFSLIGHDLRSPVINLKLIIDDLIRKHDPTEWQAMESKIRLKGTINSLYFTLDNLLHWAYTQQQGVRVHREEVFPREQVIETLELFEGMIRQKKIGIKVDIPDDAIMMADEGQLQIMIRNIVHNALKFTPVGGSLHVSTSNISSTETVLSIADSGVGMKPQNILKTRGTSGEKGTGLGLLVCKEFLVQNGGRMEIDSLPGQGTTVRLIFPRVIRDI